MLAPSRSKTRAVQILLGSVSLLLMHTTLSWSCSCIQRTACGPRHYLDSDFVGQILSRRAWPILDRISPDGILFQVRVIETFRGNQKVGDVVKVRTGLGGGDCGYQFKIGSKYLIDASRQNNIFSTSICSLTAPVEQSELELRSLRNIAAGQRAPDLTGLLMQDAGTNPDERNSPLAGVRVELESTGAGVSSGTVTDAAGSFTFPTVREGRYHIILGLPANLSAAYTDNERLAEDQAPSISIEAKNGEPAACHIFIVVEPSGSISGTVQSASGGPIEGWVNADTVTPDDRPWNTVQNAVPAPDGTFRLTHLKPGRYSVQFTSRSGFIKVSVT